MNILLFIQCFPPLLKYAGGVSKRYLTLAKSLVRQNHKVTIMTPIDVYKCNDEEILTFIYEGRIKVINIEGIILDIPDGTVIGANPFAIKTIVRLNEILPNIDVCFLDDVFGRSVLHLLFVSYNVKPIFTYHTDASKLICYKNPFISGYIDYLHNHFLFDTILTSTTKTFATFEKERSGVEFTQIWPPIIWSSEFKKEIDNDILERFADDEYPKNTTMHLFTCGRISREKRYEHLIRSIPPHYSLTIVGDTDNEVYVSELNDIIADKPNIQFKRGIADSKKLSLYYKTCDLYVSASNFETCGNTLIEAWTCGTPVAVQPEQGHLEWLKPNKNGYAIDYDIPEKAMKQLENIDMNLSELWETTNYFKHFDFDQEIQQRLLEPASKLHYTKHTRMIAASLYILFELFIGIPLQILMHYSGLLRFSYSYLEKG